MAEMKYLLMLLLLFPSVALGGGRHTKPPPAEPVEEQAPIGGSNHNAIAIALVIAAGICVYHRCWERDDQTVVKFKGKQETPQ